MDWNRCPRLARFPGERRYIASGAHCGNGLMLPSNINCRQLTKH
jgi:hypothetical protein